MPRRRTTWAKIRSVRAFRGLAGSDETAAEIAVERLGELAREWLVKIAKTYAQIGKVTPCIFAHTVQTVKPLLTKQQRAARELLTLALDHFIDFLQLLEGTIGKSEVAQFHTYWKMADALVERCTAV